MTLRLVLIVGTVALLGGCGGPSVPDRLNIAVIPKGTSHVFWQSVHAGARRAAGELNVDIIWRGPLREDDRDSQVTEVENAIARRVSGIALAPLDDAALVAPVMSARRTNIPVVIFDSGLKGGEFISFVATDNDKGGELAGAHIGKRLAGRGRVILMRYAEGHDSTSRREEGFLRGVKTSPHIEVLSSNQYLGADVEGGRTVRPERVHRVCGHARAAGQRLVGEGDVRWLRRV
jgi:ribose transport system substrate-binding protein